MRPECGFDFDVRPDAAEHVVRIELAARNLAQKVMRRIRPRDDWQSDPDALPEGPDWSRMRFTLAGRASSCADD